MFVWGVVCRVDSNPWGSPCLELSMSPYEKKSPMLNQVHDIYIYT